MTPNTKLSFPQAENVRRSIRTISAPGSAPGPLDPARPIGEPDLRQPSAGRPAHPEGPDVQGRPPGQQGGPQYQQDLHARPQSEDHRGQGDRSGERLRQSPAGQRRAWEELPRATYHRVQQHLRCRVRRRTVRSLKADCTCLLLRLTIVNEKLCNRAEKFV